MTVDENGERRGLTRRGLLARAGLTAAALGTGGALSACGPDERRGQVATDTDASQFPPLPPTQIYCPSGGTVMGFFTQEEAEALDAIVARLIPGDATDPGAREAGVPAYIDTKLVQFASFATPTYFQPPFGKAVKHPTGPQPRAGGTILVEATELPRYGFQSSSTPQEAYRKGLSALDRVARKKHGKRFAELDPGAQDRLLAAMEGGRVAGFKDAKGFFKLVLEDVYEGMFSDPLYGGNRDHAGWTLVGYPGAQRAYTADELKHGPAHKQVQGLREMPAMHPGVPQDHAILPLAGTRQTAPHGS
jgi:gluconate 2-dehydrogenase gamma chain